MKEFLLTVVRNSFGANLESCVYTCSHVCIMLSNVLHRHLPTKKLQTDPSTRRGRRVPLRGRRVSCYALDPIPTITVNKRKTKIQYVRSIPNAIYACDVCRVFLCKNCFLECVQQYDHRKGGETCDMIVVR